MRSRKLVQVQGALSPKGRNQNSLGLRSHRDVPCTQAENGRPRVLMQCSGLFSCFLFLLLKNPWHDL